MSFQQLQQQNVSAPAAYTEYSVIIPPFVINPTFFCARVARQPICFGTQPRVGAPALVAPRNLPAVYGTIPANGSRSAGGKCGGQTISKWTNRARRSN